jgi:hypothetical protein
MLNTEDFPVFWQTMQWGLGSLAPQNTVTLKMATTVFTKVLEKFQRLYGLSLKAKVIKSPVFQDPIRGLAL